MISRPGSLTVNHSILCLCSFPGLMSFEELRKRVLATSGKTRQDVTEDDLARAIKKLRVLGGGFAVIPVGKHRLVQSVPGELNMDHTAVLQKADVSHLSFLVLVIRHFDIFLSYLSYGSKWFQSRAHHLKELNYNF